MEQQVFLILINIIITHADWLTDWMRNAQSTPALHQLEREREREWRVPALFVCACIPWGISLPLHMSEREREEEGKMEGEKERESDGCFGTF